MTGARRAEATNRSRIIALIVDAFRTDPLLRWVWPDDARYAHCAPDFFGLLVDLRRAAGEVWVIEDEDYVAAAALWNPPGGLYVPAPSGVWDELRAGFTDQERHRWDLNDDAFAEQLETRTHWYLGVLATAQSHRRRGLGAAVVAPMLGAADRTGTTALLETANEANLSFYRSLAFEVADEARLPDGGPQVWLMVRPPQAAA
jgi:ribosomal protein S18 acetylase RimI-like enzyme